MKNTTLTTLSAAMLSGCVTPAQWQANHYHDEFTETKTCRVEMGNSNQREFGRAMMGTYITYNFYAENHDGEARAGIRSEPSIPIHGDVQIKVGETLYTITADDTPLDVKPANPPSSKDYAATLDTIHKQISPYRAYTGKKAKALLQDIIQQTGEVKFRTVGVNAATSGTGRFIVDDQFIASLKECGLAA